MAFLQVNFFSDALGMCTAVNVLLPQQPVAAEIGTRVAATAGDSPVLYLLHGLSDDQTIWMRRTSIERYAAQKGIAVVMPCCNRSYYCNTADGMRFWDYVAQELPELMHQFFHLSTKREQTFAAGLSMGGYGALKLAFSYPERYGAVVGFSSALHLAKNMLADGQLILPEGAFGEAGKFDGSQLDVYHLAEELTPQKAPAIYLSAGLEDPFFPNSLQLHELLERRGIAHEWHAPHGRHDWEFWDANIVKALDWLPVG